MVKIEDAAWGLRIEVQAQPTKQELSKLLDDLRKTLPSARSFFGVILDMSGTGLVNPDLKDTLIHAERLFQARGMVRMAACASSALAASQIRRISSETGVAPGLRCLDTSSVPDWRSAAEHWAVSGREPDGSKASPSAHPG